MRTLICSALLLICVFHVLGQNKSLAGSGNLTADVGDTIKYNGAPSFCEGGTIILTANNAPGNASFQWQKDGSDINGARSLSYTASVPGTYTVIVTSNGQPTTYPSLVVISNPKPIPDFSFNNNNACSGTNIDFTANITSGTAPFSYSWDFGDGSALSTSQSPAHAYTSLGCGTGTYTIKLTVTDANGCSNAITKQITVKQAPDVRLTDQNNFSPFKNCDNNPTPANPNYTITVTNSSPNPTCIASYLLDWGDGSPVVANPTFPITHTYTQLGAFNIVFSGVGTNGCSYSKTYTAANQSNPDIGIATFGSTIGCAPLPVSSIITTWQSNSPGTTYLLQFGDGSTMNLTHPLKQDFTNDTIYHTFNTSPCPSPTYQLKITATNGCKSKSFIGGDIEVRTKPQPKFSIPNPSYCVNQNICFTNQTAPGYYSNCSTTTNFTWDFGDGTPVSTTTNPCHSYSSPGTYTITLTSANPCGSGTATQQVCIIAAPVASFSVDKTQGCAPINVNTTNTSNTLNSCAAVTYLWTVTPTSVCGTASWSFAGGTNANSVNPIFSFNTAGTYVVTLSVTSSCGTVKTTQTVTVKDKPIVSINVPTGVCQNGSITPSATVSSCNATSATYEWTFQGGIPSSANSANPGAISYTTSGSYQVSLTVTNECGSTTVNKTINVTVAPDVTVPQDQVYCAGSSVTGITFTGSVSGTSYSWTNSNTAIGLTGSGTGNSLPSFTATNSGTNPITSTITVVPSTGCFGQSKSFTITVNPRPSAPTVSSPITYCLDETATQLSAGTVPGNTVLWYNNSALTGGSSTVPIPNTSSAGSTTYYVTQTNSYNCISQASSISVTVNPKITGNTIGNDQTICTNTTPGSITSQATIAGGNNSFSYQWQSTGGGQVWTNIAGATTASYSPGSLSSGIQYRRIVNSSVCSDTSNVVTITVQGTLTNIDITGPQTICSGSIPSLLIGQVPAGGNGSFIYQWESSGNGTTWSVISGETGSDYQPLSLTSTTYFRRLTKSGPCSGYSSSVLITVNPIPAVNTITDKVYCNGSSVTGINFVSIPNTGISYSWTNNNTQVGLAASGTGMITSFIATNTNTSKEPLIANISVTPTYTNAGKSCTGNAGNFKVIVLPTIVVNPINNETICTNVTIPSYTPVNDASNYQGSSVSYGWTVSGTGITLTNGSGLSIPSFKGINNGTTDLVATITVTSKYAYGGLTCNGTPTNYTVTVKPGTPPANAGPDAVLCAADTYTMKANQPSSATGTWIQIGSTTAAITNSSSATTTITGLVPGNSYTFEWSLTGFASCPDTKDTIVISIDPDIVNTIATATQTTCFGGQIVVNGDLPIGGNGTYSYQWQQSTDNITWVNIAGATSASLTFIPAQSVYVKRVVTSLPCKNESLPAQIIVQPGITNNKISQDQSICINTSASTITGALPSGGDGVYSYQWEQSTNGGSTWTTIPGASTQDYSPGILTTTTKYRRLVSTTLCSGPQANTSNHVTITVNPDAKAVFNPTTTIGCIPFKITPAVINLQTYPLQNSQYLWYANNVLIGSGTTFPGYTMNNDNDTVTIKLVAVSAFGCLSDSVSHDFYTYETPQPSFTVSDTVGCGPFTVQINNTTPKINSFSYQWNFGNGQTSNLAQPGQITFLPSPNHRDTTYQIKLSVASACSTMNALQLIRVKSKPKALFAPDKSVGCSPMTVTFNNTSLGISNNYIWDFGDGSTQVNTANLAAVNHTFTTGVQDTFFVKLIAMNECGNDTLKYAIVVSPNQIHLDFAINGSQFSGCSPHAVQFVNNSSGATLFSWNFGDNNNINTTRNIDTVSHTYFAAGNYTVTLKATNGCSDTTSTETIIVFAKPKAKFAAIPITACIGDSIRFTNQSNGATSYLWILGDGNSVTLTNPVYKYSTPGTNTVNLIASSFNAPNTVCSDTISQPIQIVSTMPGSISVSDTIGYCAPFTVSFNNLNLPSITAIWDFGDGSNGSGNSVTHTYTTAGSYQVTLNVTVPGGCNYITKKTIRVLGPGGSWSHTTGYLCNSSAAYFQVVANNADSLIYQFGDGTVLTTTINTVSHVYANGGTYLPSVLLKNKAGCLVQLQGIDSIKADKIKVGFRIASQQYCGYTVINFTDTTHAYFGKSKVEWLFGDGTGSAGSTAAHTYNTTGNYPVKLIVAGNSGCSDTLSMLLTVVVYSKPVASIVADPVVCARYPVVLGSSMQSGDAINVTGWTLSNGVTSTNPSFNYSFNQAGNYTMQLIVGTVNGCYDTASSSIKVNPTPNVIASGDLNICRGSSASISANGTGVNDWNWFPQSGLSCTTCTNTVASPLVTTPYVIEGKNNFGCSAFDTVVVTVIQPLHMKVSPSDSLCIGESINLLASGASSYNWSPATGLNNITLSNPTAAPSVTTSYRVVGYDGFNCFTDTAFVTVGVGQYPKVDLGPDLTLAAGTLQPLSTIIQNGPIRSWSWTPTTNLSCTNCALPIATIKKNTSYIVKVTTAYGCSATDTISIKVFCEDSQTFIPNAFTPDGDGINDILMVRGKGVVMVKSFRVFNRWGQVVFEKTDFAPNDPAYGWNGKINDVIGGPDVYVYTAEVMCENGATFTYKGNVSLIK